MNKLQKLSRQLVTEATRRKLREPQKISAEQPRPVSGSTRPHAAKKHI